MACRLIGQEISYTCLILFKQSSLIILHHDLQNIGREGERERDGQLFVQEEKESFVHGTLA